MNASRGPRAFLLVVSTALALTGLGGISPANATDPSISGRVVDSDGHPVAGELVSAVDANNFLGTSTYAHAVTAADGSYSLSTTNFSDAVLIRACSTVDGATCRSRAHRPYADGYAGATTSSPTWLGLRDYFTRPDTGLWSDVVAPDIEVLSTGSVKIRLGAAPTKIVSFLYSAGTWDQIEGWHYKGTSPTTRTITGLTPGRYLLEIEPSSIDGTNPDTWGTHSQPFVVEAGKQITVDEPDYAARGVGSGGVTGTLSRGGQAMPGKTIRLRRDGYVRTTSTSRSGKFLFARLPAGKYLLESGSFSSTAIPFHRSTVTVASGSTTKHNLSSASGGRLAVTFPRTGCPSTASLGYYALSLVRTSDGLVSVAAGSNQHSATPWRLSVAHVPAGKYEVIGVCAFNYSSVDKTFRGGTVTVTNGGSIRRALTRPIENRSTLVINPGTAAVTAITLAEPNHCTSSGRVDSRSVPIMDCTRRNDYAQAVRKFTHVLPGRYLVRAFYYSGTGKSYSQRYVTVGAGTTTISMPTPHQATVVDAPVTLDGNDVPWPNGGVYGVSFMVTCQDDAGPGQVLNADTGEGDEPWTVYGDITGGRIHLHALEAGTYTCRFMPENLGIDAPTPYYLAPVQITASGSGTLSDPISLSLAGGA